jgi:hypothetical protein
VHRSNTAALGQNLAGVDEFRTTNHDLMDQMHGKQEEGTANSPRLKMRAKTDRGRCMARDGGRRAPAMVRRRRVSKRERGKEGKQAL